MEPRKACEKDILAGVNPPLVSLLSSYCIQLALDAEFIDHDRRRQYEIDLYRQVLHRLSKELSQRLFSAFHITIQELLCRSDLVEWTPIGEFAFDNEVKEINFKPLYFDSFGYLDILTESKEMLIRELTEVATTELTTDTLLNILESHLFSLLDSQQFYRTIDDIAVLTDGRDNFELNHELVYILTSWAEKAYRLLNLFVWQACNLMLNRGHGSVILDHFGSFSATEEHELKFKASEECIRFITYMRHRLHEYQFASRRKAS